MPRGTTGELVGVSMPGNQAQQVVEQHEEKDAGDEGLEALVAVADDLLGLAAGELVDHLGDLLRRIGLLHRQRQPHQDEKSDEAASDQQFQRKRVVDGSGGIGGMNADCLKKQQ